MDGVTVILARPVDRYPSADPGVVSPGGPPLSSRATGKGARPPPRVVLGRPDRPRQQLAVVIHGPDLMWLEEPAMAAHSHLRIVGALRRHGRHDLAGPTPGQGVHGVCSPMSNILSCALLSKRYL